MIGFSPILGTSIAGWAEIPVAQTRIYLVDDHPLIRHGLTLLIAGEPDLTVCGEAGDAETAFQEIQKLVPDVVIVDIALNGNSGLALIKNLKSHHPELGIIALSVHDENMFGLRALKAGARGYVTKADSVGKIVDAIRQVRAGGVFVSPDLANRMLGNIRMGQAEIDPSPAGQLSDRELEIVALIGRGCTTREVASRLHVSIKTIETHRTHIKTKLQFENSTQLVQFCVRWARENESQVPKPKPIE